MTFHLFLHGKADKKRTYISYVDSKRGKFQLEGSARNTSHFSTLSSCTCTFMSFAMFRFYFFSLLSWRCVSTENYHDLFILALRYFWIWNNLGKKFCMNILGQSIDDASISPGMLICVSASTNPSWHTSSVRRLNFTDRAFCIIQQLSSSFSILR